MEIKSDKPTVAPIIGSPMSAPSSRRSMPPILPAGQPETKLREPAEPLVGVLCNESVSYRFKLA